MNFASPLLVLLPIQSHDCSKQLGLAANFKFPSVLPVTVGYLYPMCFLWSNCVTDCYQIVLSSTVPEARCHDYPRCHLLVPSSMRILYVYFFYNWIIISWSLLKYISISPHKSGKFYKCLKLLYLKYR